MLIFWSPNIAKLKAKRNIGALIRALEWPKDKEVRKAARKALVEIGGPAVKPLLYVLSTCKSESERDKLKREETAIVFSEMGELSVRLIIDVLKDAGKDKAMRKAAGEALVRIGAFSVEPLLRLLRYDSKFKAYFNQYNETELCIISVLEQISATVEAVIPLLSLSSKESWMAADILVRVGSSDGDARERIIEYLHRERVIFTGNLVLAHLGDESALEPLLEYVLKGLELVVQSGDPFAQGRADTGYRPLWSKAQNDWIEKALLNLSHQSSLSELAIKLAVKAVTYKRAFERLHHTEDSLQAVKDLCNIKGLAVSNILYKIIKIEDRQYMGRSDWEVLSFEKHRQIASEELKKRRFSTYDPSHYFATNITQ